MHVSTYHTHIHIYTEIHTYTVKNKSLDKTKALGKDDVSIPIHTSMNSCYHVLPEEFGISDVFRILPYLPAALLHPGLENSTISSLYFTIKAK